MVAARINFQQGAKRNLKPMEIKEKHEPKGKNHPQNSSKSNSSNNKAKDKGDYKGKNRLTHKELERYRKDNRCFKCGEQGHSYRTCFQRNALTNFEWVSPVVVTPKKNGKWRVCVDYKPLNAATKRDHFPLPFQDEILNEVAGHERYIVCDGYSGYYQIRIVEEDQHKTTFITPWGCFAFRVMPFGLTNAPSTFTRFTSFIFQPFFGKSIRVFLDDFRTYSDRALHCQRVEEGLQRLYQYGGQLNLDKCHVAEKEVVLLGHVISQEGIKVDPSRVQAILDLLPHKSARQVITFLQKVRYMSRFIHLLSQIISPLQQLANQEVFSWEQEHLECFNEVKEVLGSLPTIMPPDPQGIYYLCPSVGMDAFGDVLMQKDPNTAYMRPIYFTSKVMTQGQKGHKKV
ncbi:hypothetical protein L7F22_024358 [Adiantum nelumboides]|nr:hypothetical protein [Adiantum nelumboides]